MSGGRGVIVAAVLAVAAACGQGCFQPRPEKPAERIHRMRLQYRISGIERETRTGKDGRPELVMKLAVANTGKEKLGRVTVLLTVKAPDGSVTLTRPLTLDVAGIAPGGHGEITAVVPGINATEDDDVSLKMEDQPRPEVRPTYPEYRGTVN